MLESTEQDQLQALPRRSVTKFFVAHNPATGEVGIAFEIHGEDRLTGIFSLPAGACETLAESLVSSATKATEPEKEETPQVQ